MIKTYIREKHTTVSTIGGHNISWKLRRYTCNGTRV